MAPKSSIRCPSCGTEVEITEALYRQAESELRARWEEQTKARLEQTATQVREEERTRFQNQVSGLRQQLEQSTAQIEEIQRKERELQQAAIAIERQKAGLEAEVERKLREMVGPLREELKIKASDEAKLELADLKNQLAEQAARLQQAGTAELEYRKRVRELENEKRDLDLTVQRKLDEERSRIEVALRQTYSEQSELKLREKDQQIDRLRQAVDELKRKSEQGSVELQGEVLELDIEERLRVAFPQDLFDPVARGARGADVVHLVRNSKLDECGRIIWEAKNSKNWSTAWIAKLKEDQRTVAANLAVLVSVSMPRDLTHFGVSEGVCVCTPQCVLPVATLLRERLEEVSFVRGASQARKEKTDLIFEYVSGDEFRHQVEAIIDAFAGLRSQIVRERRAMEKQWREREKLLEIVMSNTSRMYGDIRGIAGASIKEIPSLELEPDTLMLEDSQGTEPQA